MTTKPRLYMRVWVRGSRYPPFAINSFKDKGMKAKPFNVLSLTIQARPKKHARNITYKHAQRSMHVTQHALLLNHVVGTQTPSKEKGLKSPATVRCVFNPTGRDSTWASKASNW